MQHASLHSAAAKSGVGLFKGKWRRLQTSTVAKISVMQGLLLAACHLHNYVIDSGCVYDNMDTMSVREHKSLATELDFHIDWTAPEWQTDLDNDGIPEAEEAEHEDEDEVEQERELGLGLGDEGPDKDSTALNSSDQLRTDVAWHGFSRYLLWRHRVKGKQLSGTVLGAHIAQMAIIHEQLAAITKMPAGSGD